MLTSDLKLGIIAGGQLGKMLIQEASKWGIHSYILDECETAPAVSIATVFIKGNYKEFEPVYQFGKMVDILTFEVENVNIEALKKLKSEGFKIYPDPFVIEIVQDKGLQKLFYRKNDISTVPFKLFEGINGIKKALKSNEIKIPFVQKLRRGGYDGRGIVIINSEKELNQLLVGASLIEEKANIYKEISVIAARNANGEIKCYPVVEMIFNSNANLLDSLICPSDILKEQADDAIKIATRIIESLDMAGILAVEFFIDNNGKLFVNELAPRPHNSGHHTIESIMTSQFEQHLRAILNLPLGSTELKMSSVMINITGDKDLSEVINYRGLTRIMEIDGVKIHLYGKKTVRPHRKMGHITILANNLELALRNLQKVKHILKYKP
jgi:5-(carboxyamino)imidazole ribonucleotide synthase